MKMMTVIRSICGGINMVKTLTAGDNGTVGKVPKSPEFTQGSGIHGSMGPNGYSSKSVALPSRILLNSSINCSSFRDVSKMGMNWV